MIVPKLIQLIPKKEKGNEGHKYKLKKKSWSSGYWRQLMFERSWVQILAPYTGWTFFKLICCKNCIVCLKRQKINEKEAGVGPFLKSLWRLLPAVVVVDMISSSLAV